MFSCVTFWPIAVLFIKYYEDGKYYLSKGNHVLLKINFSRAGHATLFNFATSVKRLKTYVTHYINTTI